MMRKKIINAIMLLGVAGIVGSGAAFTTAYLISSDNEVNTFYVPEASVDITEDFYPPTDPSPGDVITKKPRAVNTGDTNIYVRMRAEISNSDLLEPITANSGWTLKADGYYYYNKVLSPGESTETLFDSVIIKKDALKEDLKNLDVLVYAEAVQAGKLTAEQAWATMD